MIEHELRRLLADTKQKEELKAELLKAGRRGDPMKRFCEVCLKNGYEIYLGELFAYGQDMNDSKLRSTNGGGSFEIDGWSDAFENLLSEIEQS